MCNSAHGCNHRAHIIFDGIKRTPYHSLYRIQAPLGVSHHRISSKSVTSGAVLDRFLAAVLAVETHDRAKKIASFRSLSYRRVLVYTRDSAHIDTMHQPLRTARAGSEVYLLALIALALISASVLLTTRQWTLTANVHHTPFRKDPNVVVLQRALAIERLVGLASASGQQPPSSPAVQSVWHADVRHAIPNDVGFYDAIPGITHGAAPRALTVKGVSFAMHNSDRVIKWVTTNPGEQFVTRVALEALQPIVRGATDDNSDVVVLDIGANAGFYGMLALGLGYHVVFFDPQPQCVYRILYGIRANDAADRARVVPHGVSSIPDSYIPVSNETDCIGIYPMDEMQAGTIGARSDTRNSPNVSVRSVLDTRRDWRIQFLKIDTEGHELFVLRDMLPFFESLAVEHAVVELSPKFWDTAGVAARDVADVVVRIAGRGYAARTHNREFVSSDALHAWIAAGIFGQVDLHLQRVRYHDAVAL